MQMQKANAQCIKRKQPSEAAFESYLFNMCPQFSFYFGDQAIAKVPYYCFEVKYIFLIPSCIGSNSDPKIKCKNNSGYG